MKSTTLFSLLAATGAFLNAPVASAQSVPPSVRNPAADNTLGTQVSGSGNNFDITGGLNRGQTLFHSFKDFSIPTGGAANFNHPVGTRDIITRVTGNLFSDINGTLNSNGANFLLINPNGVVFGPNVKLNVGKAFAASTASGVDLVDGQGRQVTFGTNPNGDAPLLTINPNVFLNVSRLNMGANVPNNLGIVNYGTLQTNNDSQYIGLIGGNVTLDGKSGGGKIVAPGGRIDLGGLNSAGTVSTDAQGLVFGGNGLVRGDVLLTDGASVSARATQTLGTVNPFFSNLAFAGSNININANNLNILNSRVKSAAGFAAIDNGLEQNSGVKTQSAGDINVNATGLVNLDHADIKNTLRSGASGKIGDIKINANSLDLSNGSLISTLTSGNGDAGNIDVKTSGDIRISGSTPQSTQPVTNDSDNSSITSSTNGQGNAGKITIDTQNIGKLSLSNNADISSGIYQDAVGNGNDITISAKSIDLINKSSIGSSNFGGKGDAGNINIKTLGDIIISGATPQSTQLVTNDSNQSTISSFANGPGNSGGINIDTQHQGKLLLSNKALIFNSIVGEKTVGNGKDIKISAQAVDLRNGSAIISLNTGGKGDAGNITIETIGDVSISRFSNPQLNQIITQQTNTPSAISSSNFGQGNAGKITIDTHDRGKVSLDRASISSAIDQKAVGNSGGIAISAREIDLSNVSLIFSANLGGKGDAGNIDLKTSGDISISGFTPDSTTSITANSSVSSISSDTLGQGNAGKITIDTQNRGKLSLSNNAFISSEIGQNAVGNGGKIEISAREIALSNSSKIGSNNLGGKGNAGNIDIKTSGDISISGFTPESTTPITANSNLSLISSSTSGQGNAGKITIDTQNRGKLSLSNRAIVNSTINPQGVGNGGEIAISVRAVDLRNQGFISSSNLGGKGDGGNIDLKTIGDISISDSVISSTTGGQGNAGQITIDTQNLGKLSLVDGAFIFSGLTSTAIGNSQDITISAREVNLRKNSLIDSQSNGTGDAANVKIDTTGGLEITNGSAISSSNIGRGKTGDISLGSDLITLNGGTILAFSKGSTGGNIQLTTRDRLLLRNSSKIATNSSSTEKNGNGGNIAINSPLIIALPGDNNISADATGGNGGRVDIISQGLFGIKYRPKGQESDFTNDITSSSTFGQSGVVDISTPGTDPGKDSTVLPTVPTDASNQIAQTCNASRENKFIIVGRGGLPTNANDPLTSDVVWQDAHATTSQPTPSSTTNNPNQLPPPAVGLAFDGKGKAFLIAAGNEGQPTKTIVTCPNVVKK